jgi:hypothetical protein
MFSVRQKRDIADQVEALLRATGHPELPADTIPFRLQVWGKQGWSFAVIENNGAVPEPTVNPWNEAQDPKSRPPRRRGSRAPH